ncbi:DUF3859 domain-containing protein [Ancylomarina euxinus]|uniref:DUF3859 domain-containing protein n=1 Tax=Ancylomarina euxinus TaxID=2283627 RepID=A0A425XXI5_9BACT|nr:DUF3859 domain-containing protein [Ancylomarina euxinus]MCZ4694701.1 DUF3859 domain-containing protein [Ancylomarina euxinus]MUP16365.1 DUF3859 domain-containing protein [Ancylomarina euxinus]RRG19396.1 DUF3859 domain-containing protein [Ancylomarina euxinus]
MNIEIVDYSICQAIGNTTKDVVSDSATGYFLHSDDMAFIERTDIIYPKAGLSFGISYRFETDTEVSDLVEFECRIKHPKMINPTNNEAFTEILETKDEWSDELGFDFYTLEFDWEIQFGEWIFEIIHDGKVLASQSFYLKELENSKG